jgi:hypothetical protein
MQLSIDKAMNAAILDIVARYGSRMAYRIIDEDVVQKGSSSARCAFFFPKKEIKK